MRSLGKSDIRAGFFPKIKKGLEELVEKETIDHTINHLCITNNT